MNVQHLCNPGNLAPCRKIRDRSPAGEGPESLRAQLMGMTAVEATDQDTEIRGCCTCTLGLPPSCSLFVSHGSLLGCSQGRTRGRISRIDTVVSSEAHRIDETTSTCM